MQRELTGRHVLMIFIAFFGTITAVNVYMASQAIGTFPGLEGQNTYYASRDFDADRKAQEALGWSVKETYANGQLEIAFTDEKTGEAVRLADLQVLVGRATIASSDQRPVFIHENGRYIAPVALESGKWLLRIEGRAEDGTRFRQSRQLYIAKG